VIYHLLQLGGAAQALIARPAAKTLVYAALTSAIALNSGVSGAFIYFRF
jgi:hypothetical protein